MFLQLLHFLIINEERHLYKQLAKKHQTTSWNVYRVANGKTIRTLRDGCIYRELYRKGFVHM